MKVTLTEPAAPPKHTNNLKDFPENTLGVIRKWDCNLYDEDHNVCKNVLVVRKGNVLYYLSGLILGDSHRWNNFENLSNLTFGDYIIDVLPAGSKVTIEV